MDGLTFLDQIYVDDLVRAGACSNGVYQAIAVMPDIPAAMRTQDAIRISGSNTDWVLKASRCYGSGSGYGSGNGNGNGYGSGSGSGSGNGNGYGSGNGYGDGYGSGYGDGYGDGSGASINNKGDRNNEP